MQLTLDQKAFVIKDGSSRLTIYKGLLSPETHPGLHIFVDYLNPLKAYTFYGIENTNEIQTDVYLANEVAYYQTLHKAKCLEYHIKTTNGFCPEGHWNSSISIEKLREKYADAKQV